ncbi:24443_t:CDS:2, partial [Racocetra persica]
MAGCKVILLMNNTKVHSVGNLKHRNTTIKFFPPYTTSRLQPIDAVVIIEVSLKTIKNCLQHTRILPLVQDNDKEPTTNDNDDDIMEELYNNIELINFQNVIDLEEYIDYLEKKIVTEIMSDQKILNQAMYQEPQQVKSDKEDDSIDMPQITHKEALDAVYQMELYLMQQDLNYVVQTEYDVALSKLYEL